MFRFKQFCVRQEGSAMKVGTDGVLIGAWSTASTQSIRMLDIGTGTGLIALMMAQRNPNAMIDAVEVDPISIVQAHENIEDSRWSDRINVTESAIQQFAQTTSNRYDTIVSNPPFFSNSLLCPNQTRTLARHNGSLPMDELMSSVAKLLKDSGRFSIIIPSDQASKATDTAQNVGLFVSRICDVYPTINSPEPKRAMIEFTKEKIDQPVHTKLTIELDRRMSYSAEYIALTADFYLKF